MLTFIKFHDNFGKPRLLITLDYEISEAETGFNDP